MRYILIILAILLPISSYSLSNTTYSYPLESTCQISDKFSDTSILGINVTTISESCVSSPSNSTYLNPTITVKSRICILGSCVCDNVTLSANGGCDWLMVQGVPQRVCARVIGPNQSIPSSESSIKNNSNVGQICAFVDSCDGTDTDGCVIGKQGTMAHHYKQDMTSASGSPQYINQVAEDGLYNVLEAQEVLGKSGRCFSSEGISPILYPTGVNLGNPIGCVDFPAGPPPQSYSKTLPPPNPVLIAERVCNSGESPYLSSNISSRCVKTDPSMNGFGASNNSFEQNLIRVGYNNNIPLCFGSTTTCVNIYASSSLAPSGPSAGTVGTPTAGANNNLIYTCGDSRAGSNPCVVFTSDITNPGSGPYRLSYTYSNDPNSVPTNYYSPCFNPLDSTTCLTPAVTPTLYGVNIGNFYDLGAQFNTAFVDTDISKDTASGLNLYGNSVSSGSNSYVTGNGLTNPYTLTNIMTTTPLSFNVFSYIDAVGNGTQIWAYEKSSDGSVNVISSFPRSPITDIAVGGGSTSHTKPTINVQVGPTGQVDATGKPLSLSAVVGISCNPNWSGSPSSAISASPTNCQTVSSSGAYIIPGVYIHGINFNDVVVAQSSTINTYPDDYISYSSKTSTPINNNYCTSNCLIGSLSTPYCTTAPNISLGSFLSSPSNNISTCSMATSSPPPGGTQCYINCMQPLPASCPTGNTSYDCSGAANGPTTYSSYGYLSGIEFYNNNYLRGASTICLNTSTYNSLIPANTVLARTANPNQQSSRLIPASSGTTAVTSGSFISPNLPITQYSSATQICYSGRAMPTCNITPSSSCCDSCPSTTSPCGMGVTTTLANSLISAATTLSASTDLPSAQSALSNALLVITNFSGQTSITNELLSTAQQSALSAAQTALTTLNNDVSNGVFSNITTDQTAILVSAMNAINLTGTGISTTNLASAAKYLNSVSSLSLTATSLGVINAHLNTISAINALAYAPTLTSTIAPTQTIMNSFNNYLAANNSTKIGTYGSSFASSLSSLATTLAGNAAVPTSYITIFNNEVTSLGAYPPKSNVSLYQFASALYNSSTAISAIAASSTTLTSTLSLASQGYLGTVQSDLAAALNTSSSATSLTSQLQSQINTLATALNTLAGSIPTTTTNFAQTANDLSYQLNANETIRTKLPWEIPSYVSGVAKLGTSLCVPVASPAACGAISTPGASDGNATWSSTNVSNSANGTCITGYTNSSSGSPTRTCYAMGDIGMWGPVTNPCGAASCPAITSPGTNDGNAKWSLTNSGSTTTGTCVTNYYNQQAGTATRTCNNGSWSAVTNPCGKKSSCKTGSSSATGNFNIGNNYIVSTNSNDSWYFYCYSSGGKTYVTGDSMKCYCYVENHGGENWEMIYGDPSDHSVTANCTDTGWKCPLCIVNNVSSSSNTCPSINSF